MYKALIGTGNKSLLMKVLITLLKCLLVILLQNLFKRSFNRVTENDIQESKIS